jgi:hypothetical protein
MTKRNESEDKFSWLKFFELCLSVLTPIAVVFATSWLNHSNDARAAANADREDRLARLSLVPAFIDALAGEDQKKRLLAIRTVSIVLPEDGPALLNGIVGGDQVDQNSNAEAQQILGSHLGSFVDSLYRDQSSSNRAFEYLNTGSWNNDVLANSVFTNAQPSNAEGLNKSLLILQNLPVSTLGNNVDRMKALVQQIPPSDAENRAFAQKILQEASQYKGQLSPQP